MTFIEFTRKSGSKVAVNGDRVSRIQPAETGGTQIHLAAAGTEVIIVAEDYTTVFRELSATEPRRAAATWMGPR